MKKITEEIDIFDILSQTLIEDIEMTMDVYNTKGIKAVSKSKDRTFPKLKQFFKYNLKRHFTQDMVLKIYEDYSIGNNHEMLGCLNTICKKCRINESNFHYLTILIKYQESLYPNKNDIARSKEKSF